MRKPVVSRTFKTAIVRVMCVNITEKETFEQVITLPRPLKEKALEKAVRAIVEADPAVKFVHVIDVNYETVLYGMSEEEFLSHATILPPRTTTED